MELRLLQSMCPRAPTSRRPKASTSGTRRPIYGLVSTYSSPSGSRDPYHLALALCVCLMGLMSVAIIWQAQIIANQRDAIRFLKPSSLAADISEPMRKSPLSDAIRGPLHAEAASATT